MSMYWIYILLVCLSNIVHILHFHIAVLEILLMDIEFEFEKITNSGLIMSDPRNDAAVVSV